MRERFKVFRSALNHPTMGFSVRFASAAVVLGFSGTCAAYFGRQWNDALPIAQRYRCFQRWHETKFVHLRRDEKYPNMLIVRFSLPNTFDCLGYDPISSVRVSIPNPVTGIPSRRWYTPISHPSERGFVDFAIHDTAGLVAHQMLQMRSGDRIYLGRWLRQFKYEPNRHTTVGVVATQGCSSVALQLLECVSRHLTDTTKVKVLLCVKALPEVAFHRRYLEYKRMMGSRLEVHYNAVSYRKGHDTSSGQLDLDGIPVTFGLLEAPILERVLPPSSAEGIHVFVCGPPDVVHILAGRWFSNAHGFHLSFGALEYTGFLKDLGYSLSQVTKFGSSSRTSNPR